MEADRKPRIPHRLARKAAPATPQRLRPATLSDAARVELRARLRGARGVSLPRRMTTVCAFLTEATLHRLLPLEDIRTAYRAALRRWPSKRVALNALRVARTDGWLQRVWRGVYALQAAGAEAEARAFARSTLTSAIRQDVREQLPASNATTLTRRFTVLGYYISLLRRPSEFTLDDLREAHVVISEPFPDRSTAATALGKAMRRGWLRRRRRGVYTITGRGRTVVRRRFQ